MKAKAISVSEFVQKLNDHIGKNNFAFFLGAGASVKANIPLASEMINEWKIQIYRKLCEQPDHNAIAQANLTQKLPQSIFDWCETYKTGKNKKAGDYGFWFEEAFPIKQERQDYIVEKIEQATELTPEYSLFAQLIEKKVSGLVITVNFDDLVADAIRFYNDKKPLVIYDDSLMWNASLRNLDKRPHILKVHGDYMFNTIRNTEDETAKLPQNTIDKLEEFLRPLGLVVMGYGGNDESVMNTLTDIAKKKASFRYGLYWCTYGAELPEKVKELENTDVEFFHIPNVSFDMIMTECQRIMNLDGIKELSEKVVKKINKAQAQLSRQITNLQNRIPDDTRDIEQLKQKAELAYFNNDYKTAIKIFNTIEKVSQGDPVLLFRWGTAYGRLEKYEEAVEKFKQAIRYKPDYVEAYNNLGVALGKLGRKEEAIEQYKQAIRYKPDYVEAYNNLGVALGKLGRNEEAIEQLKQAIKYKPDYAEAYYNLGVALGTLGKHEEAIEQYKQAIEYKPDYAEAYYNWGVALGNLEKHEEAIEQYKQAIEYKPDYAEAYNNWGVTLGNLGRYEEALEKYMKSSELKPNNDSALFNVACIYSLQKNKQEALSYLEKAIAVNNKMKQNAKTDSDFEWLWEDEDFKKLTAE